jgi:hypothetical protein
MPAAERKRQQRARDNAVLLFERDENRLNSPEETGNAARINGKQG